MNRKVSGILFSFFLSLWFPHIHICMDCSLSWSTVQGSQKGFGAAPSRSDRVLMIFCPRSFSFHSRTDEEERKIVKNSFGQSSLPIWKMRRWKHVKRPCASKSSKLEEGRWKKMLCTINGWQIVGLPIGGQARAFLGSLMFKVIKKGAVSVAVNITTWIVLLIMVMVEVTKVFGSRLHLIKCNEKSSSCWCDA